MDLVVVAGKSRKNIESFIILPPDSRQAIDALIDARQAVGVPDTNCYVFGRLNADTPLSGTLEIRELALSCPDLIHPERIRSTMLRRYIANVSQASVVCHV